MSDEELADFAEAEKARIEEYLNELEQVWPAGEKDE